VAVRQSAFWDDEPVFPVVEIHGVVVLDLP
jgi:hypothetical protein